MLAMDIPSGMHHPQQKQVQQASIPPPTQATPMASYAGLFPTDSFGSACLPICTANLQLQQAASASYLVPGQVQGGGKRGRHDRLSTSNTHSAPPMIAAPCHDDDDVLDGAAPDCQSKKRRSSQYVAPRTVPASFTSVTTAALGLRRNLSFGQIGAYVSYAQTPSLMVGGNTGDGMDMDASSGNQNPDPQSRVRSMSF